MELEINLRQSWQGKAFYISIKDKEAEFTDRKGQKTSRRLSQEQYEMIKRLAGELVNANLRKYYGRAGYTSDPTETRLEIAIGDSRSAFETVGDLNDGPPQQIADLIAALVNLRRS